MSTAVICLDVIVNVLKIVAKKLSDVKIVLTGAGASNRIVCDRKGTLYPGGALRLLAICFAMYKVVMKAAVETKIARI